jgi:hypothetical protein
MKNKTFISLIALLLLASISFIGCNDDGGGGSSQGTQALTENDFANDPSLRADAEKGVIVDFLEPPDADTPENDTGEVGNDLIPLRYDRTVEDTFCWEDDNSEAMHYMVLLDSEGNEALRVDVNGDCVTEVIEAGDYVMTLYHDESKGRRWPIFIIILDQKQQAMKADGLFNGFKVVTAKILKGIQNTISKDARAQTVQQNINTLLSTNRCPSCNLSGANLFGANLTGALLFLANLSNANLTGALLQSSDLGNANLSDAILFSARLDGAFLDATNLRRANLRFANLSNANLDFADLRGADLLSTNFSGATWCNGCVCANPSFGTCGGCPSVDICTGL